MSYTAGPWRVGCWASKCSKPEHGNNHPGLRGPNPCVYVPQFYDIGCGIAGPEPGQMVVSLFYDDLVMSDDDGRLISAAPDLLAALKTLADHAKRSIDDSGGCDHSVGICLCEEIRALDTARAAIFKATGVK